MSLVGIHYKQFSGDLLGVDCFGLIRRNWTELGFSLTTVECHLLNDNYYSESGKYNTYRAQVLLLSMQFGVQVNFQSDLNLHSILLIIKPEDILLFSINNSSIDLLGVMKEENHFLRVSRQVGVVKTIFSNNWKLRLRGVISCL